MNPTIPASIAFLNYLIGAFSNKMTQASITAMITMYVTTTAYEYATFTPPLNPQNTAIAWGVLLTFVLWFFVWTKDFLSIGR